MIHLMLSTVYKVSVAVLLALYSFMAFIAVALSGLCADTNACTAPLTAAQITVAVYTLGQWFLYAYAVRKNNKTFMRVLIYVPLVAVVGFIVFANFVES